MKIVVTGGAGFIGSHLVDALIEHGHSVTIIDNLSTGKIANINRLATFVNADITTDALRVPFEGAEIVFHLAALPRIQPSIINPFDSHAVNVTGTLRVLWEAKRTGARRLIYSASSSAYGIQNLPYAEEMMPTPRNPYAAQKFMGEVYCRMFSTLYGIDTACLRYFNVYGHRQPTEGPYSTVMGIWANQVARGQKATIVGDGTQTRDFTHVSDVVRANIHAMNRSSNLNGEVINIGSGRSISILELAQMFGYETEHIESRPGEVHDTLADVGKAKEMLGWEPKIAIKEGITML